MQPQSAQSTSPLRMIRARFVEPPKDVGAKWGGKFAVGIERIMTLREFNYWKGFGRVVDVSEGAAAAQAATAGAGGGTTGGGQTQINRNNNNNRRGKAGDGAGVSSHSAERPVSH